MTTQTIYPPHIVGLELEPSRTKRRSIYRVVLFFVMLVGAGYSFVSLKNVIFSPVGVFVYGEKRLTVTYPSVPMEQYVVFIVLAALFMFLAAVVILDLRVLPDLTFGVIAAGLSVVVALLTSAVMLSFSYSSNVTSVESSSMESIVDSNLGDNYKVVKSDSGVVYVDSDGGSYEFMRTDTYTDDGQIITWDLKTVDSE
jgi:hypothetical protein